MSPKHFNDFFSSYNKNSKNYAITRHGKISLGVVESKQPVNAEDAQTVANDVKRIFKLEDFQVEVDDSMGLGIPNVLMLAGPTDWMSISIIVSDFENNMEVIDKFMESKGYTMIRKTRMGNENDPDTGFFVVIYTPIQRVEISKELSNVPYLYHVSPIDNMENIHMNGLIPKARYGNEEEGGIIYPERVYFFTSYNAAVEHKENMEMFGDYQDIYRFPTEAVADLMDIYYDPLYGKSAVYVEHTVPGNLIVRKR